MTGLFVGGVGVVGVCADLDMEYNIGRFSFFKNIVMVYGMVWLVSNILGVCLNYKKDGILGV